MPQITMSTHVGNGTTTNKKWTPTDVVSAFNTSDYAAMSDIKTLDVALAAANGTYWTTARLDQTNIWDKLYWLRATRETTTELT